MDARQLHLHLLAQLEVECPEGLVEEEHGRSLGEGPGERDALRLASRELPRIAIVVGGQADQLEILGHALLDLAVRQPSIRRPKATLSATDMCGKSA